MPGTTGSGSRRQARGGRVAPELALRPGVHVERHPDKLAVVMADRSSALTYAQLEARSAALADALTALGLRPLDRVALLCENRPEFVILALAAQRSGLAYIPVNWHLSPDEVGYMLADSGAVVLFASEALRPLADAVLGAVNEASARPPVHRVLIDGSAPGWTGLDELVATRGTASAPAIEGQWMFYSSGTTGRPKGIIRPEVPPRPYGSGTAIDPLLGQQYGFGADTIYLSPAPLYHAAPLGWSLGTLRRGGTVVLLDHFEPELTLATIQSHRVSHAQFVPTMFIRMLKLPEDRRDAYDVSSLRMAVHAAAPCPVEVKWQMLRWWGPVLYEYYGGSEGTGFVAIGPQEWIEHPGSVGRSKRGPVHIVDDDGRELGPCHRGTVWFEGATPFEYHGDPAKTASAFDQRGWTTLGDVGYLDEDGYLYLTDRATDLVISGGVNVYPQEVERVLVLHDRVLDAGAVGAPHPELGEELVAFVQPVPGVVPTPELAETLLQYCAAHLGGYKRPRRLVFVDELPRLPTGKLLRRRLREHLSVETSAEGRPDGTVGGLSR